jgi:hypothetical protein
MAPLKEDMDYIFRELIGLSNSKIIFNENDKDIAVDDWKERNKRVPEILEKIGKYI